MGYIKYYGLGLPSFLIIVIALYLLFTGKSTPYNRITYVRTQFQPCQVRERLSTLANFWKSRVLMHGDLWALGCV